MIKVNDMPGSRGVVPPPGGWKADGVYVVLVSFLATNPMHYAILQVGFLDTNDNPGNYSELFHNSYDGVIPYSNHYRLEAVRELCVLGDGRLEFPA